MFHEYLNSSRQRLQVWLRTPIHDDPFEGVPSNHTAPAVGEKMSTSLGDNRKWTQDEIINNTRNVMRGLETLKNEHSGLLTNLSDFHLGSRNINGRSDSSAVERVKAKSSSRNRSRRSNWGWVKHRWVVLVTGIFMRNLNKRSALKEARKIPHDDDNLCIRLNLHSC